MREEVDAGQPREQDQLPANPYAAPGADGEAAEAPRAAVGNFAGYRNQKRLVQVIAVLLGLQALSHSLNIVACAGLMFSELDAAREELLLSLTGKAVQLHNIIYYAGVFPFGAFLVGANKNARFFETAAAGEHDVGRAQVLGFTPASMVWWFAVPIMNLFRPYQAVRAVWFSSASDQASIESTLRHDVVIAWWLGWIANMIWGRVTSFTERSQLDPTTHNTLVVVGSVIGIAACGLAFRMAQTLEQRQTQRAAELRH